MNKAARKANARRQAQLRKDRRRRKVCIYCERKDKATKAGSSSCRKCKADDAKRKQAERSLVGAVPLPVMDGGSLHERDELRWFNDSVMRLLVDEGMRARDGGTNGPGDELRWL